MSIEQEIYIIEYSVFIRRTVSSGPTQKPTISPKRSVAGMAIVHARGTVPSATRSALLNRDGGKRTSLRPSELAHNGDSTRRRDLTTS